MCGVVRAAHSGHAHLRHAARRNCCRWRRAQGGRWWLSACGRCSAVSLTGPRRQRRWRAASRETPRRARPRLAGEGQAQVRLARQSSITRAAPRKCAASTHAAPDKCAALRRCRSALPINWLQGGSCRQITVNATPLGAKGADVHRDTAAAAAQSAGGTLLTGLWGQWSQRC